MKVTCNEKENDIVFVPEDDNDIFNLGKMLGERKIACIAKFTADTDNKKSQLNMVQISTQKNMGIVAKSALIQNDGVSDTR